MCGQTWPVLVKRGGTAVMGDNYSSDGLCAMFLMSCRCCRAYQRCPPPTWKVSSRPGVVQAASALMVAASVPMLRMKVVCTASNSWLSAGSCRLMSSEPMKMFSRYIQLRCTCGAGWQGNRATAVRACMYTYQGLCLIEC